MQNYNGFARGTGGDGCTGALRRPRSASHYGGNLRPSQSSWARYRSHDGQSSPEGNPTSRCEYRSQQRIAT
jgi:hypothetical protein